MSSEPVISVKDLGKRYQRFANPRDRLLQFLRRDDSRHSNEFWALQNVNLDVMPGEVIGIVGRNGSGKSTLLQLVCGTLTPTAGEVSVQGRIAALLELGAGFNPEFTGRENILMSAAIMGLTHAEISSRFDEIVEFSGIGEFIDQPVKTYSSGMYVRLAFSVAISVTPDILVIDEALSVGDGAFARKSFDRIMALREAGKTILFCSHSMYQIDALCQRAIWLNRGRVQMLGSAAEVTSAYNASLALESSTAIITAAEESTKSPAEQASAPPGAGRIITVSGSCGEQTGTRLQVRSRLSTVTMAVDFILDPQLPPPTVAFALENTAGVMVSSVLSSENGGALLIDGRGRGRAAVVFPQMPLMKGEYRVAVFLACEKGLHVYDWAAQCMTLEVTQEDAAQGMVVLPHQWRTDV